MSSSKRGNNGNSRQEAQKDSIGEDLDGSDNLGGTEGGSSSSRNEELYLKNLRTEAHTPLLTAGSPGAASSQEAIAALLQAAMRSDPQEPTQGALSGQGGPSSSGEQTTAAPPQHLTASLMQHHNGAPQSRPQAFTAPMQPTLGGFPIDENLIRAMLSSQTAAARPTPDVTNATTRNTAASLASPAGFNIEQLSALAAAGFIPPPAPAPPPQPTTTQPVSSISMQDAASLFSAIILQQNIANAVNASPQNNNTTGNHVNILPQTVAGGAGAGAGAATALNPAGLASFGIPVGSSTTAASSIQSNHRDLAGLLASILPSQHTLGVAPTSTTPGATGVNLAAFLQALQAGHQARPVPGPAAIQAALLPSGQVAPATMTRSTSLPALASGRGTAPSGEQNQRKPRILHVPSDDDLLSPYQCLVRRQIEVFEASRMDIHASAQGRNRPIVLGQVGIRCIHCGSLPIESRARGAVYFPSTLMSTYQTAQNMANSHLLKDCRHIAKHIRDELIRVRLRENSESQNTRKSAFGGGRNYWARGLQTFHGVIETSDKRLRFENSSDSNGTSS